MGRPYIRSSLVLVINEPGVDGAVLIHDLYTLYILSV